MPSPSRPTTLIQLTIASESDRRAIYRIRHAVYARELGQHPANPASQLTDDLDAVNHYIVAKQNGQLTGFVSITPPTAKRYSVDKYVDRSVIPYPFDNQLYEVRLLTVVHESRGGYVALALLFAVFRWVQAHGGRYIVAIGRTELKAMYEKVGLQFLGIPATSGAVTYELAVARIDDLQQQVRQKIQRYESLKGRVDWQLPFSFFTPSACFHGGQFFKAVGEELQTLHRARQIINADVLDAWFLPSPAVLAALQENLSWLLQTSPPTHADGLIRVIARTRGVPASCILPGAGSSALIFLALRQWLTPTSRVLLLDPCYGEYAHVLQNVIQCQVSRFSVRREDDFVIDTDALVQEIERGYDLVVLVNPNSPTGVYLPRPALENLLLQIPASTLVWVDETYIEYAGQAESIEPFAVTTENVVVCKSMSKVYALSGVRSAYLCSSPHLLETLRTLTPPWAVSLPAQAAAIAALTDGAYYQERYAQTHALRASLKQELLNLGITDIVDGIANFLLFYLPPSIDAVTFLTYCQQEDLFLRNVGSMGTKLGNNAIRISVRDAPTTQTMVGILQRALAYCALSEPTAQPA